jgi:transcriptional regulator with PAS, ATPase and Fis domain
MADIVIRPAHLPSAITSGALLGDLEKKALPEGELSIDDRLRGIERGIILEALRRAGGVQVKAAQLLGISPRSLWHRVKKLDIDIGAFKELQKL